MSRYDLSLGNAVTKGGKKFTTQEPMTWHDLDDAGFAALLGMAAAVEDEVKKASNKGGDISITLTSKASSSDGGAVPAGANSTTTYAGLTRHGLSDVQEAMGDIGRKLTKMGRDHADKKEGKRKGH